MAQPGNSGIGRHRRGERDRGGGGDPAAAGAGDIELPGARLGRLRHHLGARQLPDALYRPRHPQGLCQHPHDQRRLDSAGDLLRRLARLDQRPHQLPGPRPARAVQPHSVLPQPLRRRHRLAQSGRRQDRAAQQLGARLSRRARQPAQRRQLARRDLGHRIVLRAAGLSLCRRLATAHGPLARGQRAHHRRRPHPHGDDHHPAAGRARHFVGHDHRLRHQRRRVRRAVQAQRALRLADADHADILQGGRRRRQPLSRRRHEHGARGHHRVPDLAPAELYRAALLHHRDRQGLPPQCHRPRRLEMGRLRLQRDVPYSRRGAADPLPVGGEPASGLAGRDHPQRPDAAQLRAHARFSGRRITSRRRPTASSTASSSPLSGRRSR